MHIELSAQYKTYYAAYINEIEPMTALCGA